MNYLSNSVVTYNISWFTYGYSYADPSLSNNLSKDIRACSFNVTHNFSINRVTMLRIDSLKSMRHALYIVTIFPTPFIQIFVIQLPYQENVH
ncbi:MAG: hypothetical protein LBC02_09580 [Planctomycetaceae bacterium]|nr:hypothetical protein [Planctomycetaceae bacterium]